MSLVYTLWFVMPASIYLLKVNNRNTRTRSEICSKTSWMYIIVLSFIGITYVVVKLKIFSLACRFSIREMTKFGRFLGPFSPVYDPIFAEILTKSSSLDNKTLSHNFFKDSNFYRRVGLKVCTFGPTLTFRFPRNWPK